jgi:lipid-binding SYLF domain-containing protein
LYDIENKKRHIMTRFFASRTAKRALLLFGLTLLGSHSANAVTERDAQKLVDGAYYAFMDISEGDQAKSIGDLMTKARAVMVFPSVGKGGFIIGGEGGKGILMARTVDGSWSSPAFYGMGSVSLGLQAGYQESRILLIIMSDSALTSILEGKLKLGADASIVVINEGADGELSTNSTRKDVYYYAQTEAGLFAGVSIEGSDIFTKSKYNNAYYGGTPSPADIAIRALVSNPDADRMRAALP